MNDKYEIRTVYYDMPNLISQVSFDILIQDY